MGSEPILIFTPQQTQTPPHMLSGNKALRSHIWYTLKHRLKLGLSLADYRHRFASWTNQLAHYNCSVPFLTNRYSRTPDRRGRSPSPYKRGRSPSPDRRKKYSPSSPSKPERRDQPQEQVREQPLQIQQPAAAPHQLAQPAPALALVQQVAPPALIPVPPVAQVLEKPRPPSPPPQQAAPKKGGFKSTFTSIDRRSR